MVVSSSSNSRLCGWLTPAGLIALGLIISTPASGGQETARSLEQKSISATQESYSPAGLPEADDILNEIYNALHASLPGNQAQALHDSQLTWIKERDRACGITYHGPDREKWLGHVIGSDNRKACAIRLTHLRAKELKQRLQETTGFGEPPRKDSSGKTAAHPSHTRQDNLPSRKSSTRLRSEISYPAVNSTWGDRFNPSGKATPELFKAYYFNSQNPKQVVATEQVPDISINYPWDDFHGIKSEDFGAYWVGVRRFDVDTPVEINVAMSWSKTRVIIDKRLVYEGGSSKRIPFIFSAGDHLIEVEYLNNWHTTEFAVSFSGQHEHLKPSALRQFFSGQRFDGARVLYASVYEAVI